MILKCGISLERLFKSGISLEEYKGCLEPKVQVGGWDNPIVLLKGLVWKP